MTNFEKCSILDIWLDSEYASVKFRKIISSKIMNKVTVNRKDKASAKTELRHRYLSWKLTRLWEIILDGVFQNVISADKNIFKVGNKGTSVTSVDAFLIISRHIFMNLSCREIFAGISFRSSSGFYYEQKGTHLSSYFLQFLWAVASENSPANKNMFKVDGKKRH